MLCGDFDEIEAKIEGYGDRSNQGEILGQMLIALFFALLVVVIAMSRGFRSVSGLFGLFIFFYLVCFGCAVMMSSLGESMEKPGDEHDSNSTDIHRGY